MIVGGAKAATSVWMIRGELSMDVFAAHLLRAWSKPEIINANMTRRLHP
jgi:hypothetical protein